MAKVELYEPPHYQDRPDLHRRSQHPKHPIPLVPASPAPHEVLDPLAVGFHSSLLVHLLALGDAQECPGVLEVRSGKPELRAAQDQGSDQPGITYAELEGDLPPVTVAQNERPLQTKRAEKACYVLSHQAIAEFTRRVVGPAMSAAVVGEDLEVLGEGRQVRRPRLG